MLSCEDIFGKQFLDERFDRPRWAGDGHCYTTLRKAIWEENPSAKLLHEIIWHDASTNSETTLVNLAALIVQPEDGEPLAIQDYSLSSDRRKV
jgi:hypothetical protein